MNQVHAQARTTPRTRTEIKDSPAILVELTERYNISLPTARKIYLTARSSSVQR